MNYRWHCLKCQQAKTSLILSHTTGFQTVFIAVIDDTTYYEHLQTPLVPLYVFDIVSPAHNNAWK